MDRRRFIEKAGMALVPLGVLGRAPLVAGAKEPSARPDLRVGICDWSMGGTADPGIIPRAREAGLNGIQVSIGDRPDHLPLRDPTVREQYRTLGREHGVAFPSVAAGSILNRIPLKSEPQAALFALDALDAAAALGSERVLLAFFGNGDLRLRDDQGDFIEVGDGSFSTYELDTRGVQRVVEVLQQLVPRAEDAEVVIGLENTLTAEQNLEILDAVGSDWVQVYYDVGNSTAYGYDVPGEIRRLGRDRICEVHLKETLSLDTSAAQLLGAPEQGGVDFEAAAEACRAIGYDQWYVLETGGRDGRFLEDTRANVAFAREVFA